MRTTAYPDGARIVFFGAGKPDAACLDRWRDAPLTYRRGQPTDATWHTDRYEFLIEGPDPVRLFGVARDRLLRYEFYPPDVLTHVGDFAVQGRLMRPGDRVVLRVAATGRLFRGLIEGIAMNEVVEVVDDPQTRRAGFTYVTTAVHSEMGEMTTAVEAHPQGVKLVIGALSRTRPEFPALLRGLARRVQKRAHRRGIQHFTRLVLRG